MNNIFKFSFISLLFLNSNCHSAKEIKQTYTFGNNQTEYIANMEVLDDTNGAFFQGGLEENDYKRFDENILEVFYLVEDGGLFALIPNETGLKNGNGGFYGIDWANKRYPTLYNPSKIASLVKFKGHYLFSDFDGLYACRSGSENFFYGVDIDCLKVLPEDSYAQELTLDLTGNYVIGKCWNRESQSEFFISVPIKEIIDGVSKAEAELQ